MVSAQATFSIQITSAPHSANICPANGPAISIPENTTRNPASGPKVGIGKRFINKFLHFL
ncbi:Uncharacterised protein [Citrobacter koseri]|uniref:Uncharacterized protein n=1 Tax=Citrobacter koseri TaxID=545 RepID=A0A2X2VC35_CITKO|nr:Uncharacterised protein [Citrobacter koseri]